MFNWFQTNTLALEVTKSLYIPMATTYDAPIIWAKQTLIEKSWDDQNVNFSLEQFYTADADW